LLARLGAEGAGTLQRLHEQTAGSEEAFLELYELLRQALSRRREGTQAGGLGVQKPGQAPEHLDKL
jgi:hypothetical protein